MDPLLRNAGYPLQKKVQRGALKTPLNYFQK